LAQGFRGAARFRGARFQRDVFTTIQAITRSTPDACFQNLFAMRRLWYGWRLEECMGW